MGSRAERLLLKEAKLFMRDKAPEEIITEEVVLKPLEYVISNEYVPEPETKHDQYQLHLGVLDGPLDLLLSLMKRHPFDILDIQ